MVKFCLYIFGAFEKEKNIIDTLNITKQRSESLLKISLKIDELITETEVKIICGKETPQIQKIIKMLKRMDDIRIQGFVNRDVYFIDPCDVEFFYTENKHIYTEIGEVKYEIRYKIYELDEMLSEAGFVKIEQGVIANIAKVKKVKPLFNGTMEILFQSGKKQYASRRSVSEIKRRLGI